MRKIFKTVLSVNNKLKGVCVIASDLGELLWVRKMKNLSCLDHFSGIFWRNRIAFNYTSNIKDIMTG